MATSQNMQVKIYIYIHKLLNQGHETMQGIIQHIHNHHPDLFESPHKPFLAPYRQPPTVAAVSAISKKTLETTEHPPRAPIIPQPENLRDGHVDASKDRRHFQGYIMVGADGQALEGSHADVLKKKSRGVAIPSSHGGGRRGREGDPQLLQLPRNIQHTQNIGYTLPTACESMVAMVQINQVGK